MADNFIDILKDIRGTGTDINAVGNADRAGELVSQDGGGIWQRFKDKEAAVTITHANVVTMSETVATTLYGTEGNNGELAKIATQVAAVNEVNEVLVAGDNNLFDDFNTKYSTFTNDDPDNPGLYERLVEYTDVLTHDGENKNINHLDISETPGSVVAVARDLEATDIDGTVRSGDMAGVSYIETVSIDMNSDSGMLPTIANDMLSTDSKIGIVSTDLSTNHYIEVVHNDLTSVDEDGVNISKIVSIGTNIQKGSSYSELLATGSDLLLGDTSHIVTVSNDIANVGYVSQDLQGKKYDGSDYESNIGESRIEVLGSNILKGTNSEMLIVGDDLLKEENSNVVKVSDIVDDVTTVAGKTTEITDLSQNMYKITSIYEDLEDTLKVADELDDVTIVGKDLDNRDANGDVYENGETSRVMTVSRNLAKSTESEVLLVGTDLYKDTDSSIKIVSNNIDNINAVKDDLDNDDSYVVAVGTDLVSDESEIRRLYTISDEVVAVSGNSTNINIISNDLQDKDKDGNDYEEGTSRIKVVGLNISKTDSETIAVGEDLLSTTSKIVSVYTNQDNIISIADNLAKGDDSTISIVATDLNRDDSRIYQVGVHIDNVIVTSDNIDSIVSVATDLDLGDDSTVKAVSDNMENVVNVGQDIIRVERVAQSADNVDNVSDNIGNVNIVGDDLALGNDSLIKQASDAVDDLQEIKDNIDDITTIADDLNSKDDDGNSTSKIITVSDNITNVIAVGNSIGNIDTVTKDLDKINRVYDSVDNVDRVEDSIANIDRVYTSADAIDRVKLSADNVDTIAEDIDNIDAVSDNVTKINTVADDITKVGTVADSIDNVNTVSDNLAKDDSEIKSVAGSIDSVEAVGAKISQVNTVSDNLDDGDDSTIKIVSDNITYVQDVSAHMDNVRDVSDSTDNIDSVAADVNLGDDSTIKITANNITDVNTVGTNIADVSTVSTDIASVNTTATDIGSIKTVASNLDDGDTSTVKIVSDNISNVDYVGGSIDNVNIVAENVDDGDTSTIKITADNIGSVATVGSAIDNVNTVADRDADIATIADDLNADTSTIKTVSDNITNVNSVSDISSDVSIVASRDADIGTVADDVELGDDSTIKIVADNIVDVQNAEENAILAKGYATADEDVEVEDGTYSAKNYSIKANASKVASANSESMSAEWADKDEDVEITDNAGKYSAKHHAIKADASAVAAKSSEDTTKDYLDQVSTIYDNFDDRYLGAFDTDPTEDNDGDALVMGMMYYNTDAKEIRFYDSENWDRPEFSASQSALAAADSQDAAKVSEDNAKISEDNSATSETNAKTSEDNAKTSEDNSKVSEDNAAASESKANEWAEKDGEVESGKYSSKHWADAASSSASSAKDSEDAAKVSEDNSKTSEDNALSSETKASKWASEVEDTEVETDKYSALHYAAKASASADSANTSETNSSASETLANKWAEEVEDTEVVDGKYSALHHAAKAESSASAASTSEINAKTSEDNANDSMNTAVSARDEAVAVYDNFDDRYLGAKDTAPDTDNDGDDLITGALYFDTDAGAMQVYDGTDWTAAYISDDKMLDKTKNLSDLDDTSIGRTNLGVEIGVDVLAYSADVVIDSAYVHTDNNYTTEYKDKLDGIADNAEVNVQSDWNVTDDTLDTYIANKPNVVVQESIIDEDDMASDSDVKIPTQQSVKAFASNAGNLTSGVIDDARLPDEITSNTSSASIWKTARKITLEGDTDGDVTIDGSADVTLTVTVKDDSHSHIIDNIDGLADSLDSKLDDSQLDTTSTLGTDDTKIPSQKAVKTYVDTSVSVDTTNFDGVLGSNEDTIQKAFDKLDDIVLTSTMEDLTNVSVTDITASQILAWDNDNTVWKNIDIPESGEYNVQADWNETDTAVDSYILNKPDVVTVDRILDEDDMDSDSNTSVPTQQSVRAYVEAMTSQADANAKLTKVFQEVAADGQTEFKFASDEIKYLVDSISVFTDGVISDIAYTADDGVKIVFDQGLEVDTEVTLIAYGGADVYTKQQIDTKLASRIVDLILHGGHADTTYDDTTTIINGGAA